MNNKNWKRICFVTTFSLLLAANGCSVKSGKQILDNTTINGNQTTEELTSSENNTLNGVDDKEPATTQDKNTSESAEPDIVEPAATKEIFIYTVNEATQGVESVVALIPQDSEITPELIVDQVTDSLADRLITVGIDEVTAEKDTVIVSFKADQPPLTNVGSSLEKTILDAIAQSLVDNLEESPKVIFRVEGKAYSSGNFSFGLDEVYLDNSKTK